MVLLSKLALKWFSSVKIRLLVKNGVLVKNVILVKNKVFVNKLLLEGNLYEFFGFYGFFILIYDFLDKEIKRVFWESNRVGSRAQLMKAFFFYQFLVFKYWTGLQIKFF